MATGGDTNFNTACFGERSMAQMFLGKALHAVSAAAPNSQPIRREDGVSEGENLVRNSVEKRALMNIDLNVVPPEDADCELAVEDGSRNGEEIRMPAADVAPDVSVSEVVEPNSDWIAEEVSVEVKTKTAEIRADAEAEMVEKSSRNKRWFALLEFAENALVEREEENRKRRASQEPEPGGEPVTRRQRRQSVAAEWNGENEVAAVVRSSRGRAVAMPNKYRDSVMGAVAMAEAEFPRRSKNAKSATVSSTKRKSR